MIDSASTKIFKPPKNSLSYTHATKRLSFVVQDKCSDFLNVSQSNAGLFCDSSILLIFSRASENPPSRVGTKLKSRLFASLALCSSLSLSQTQRGSLYIVQHTHLLLTLSNLCLKFPLGRPPPRPLIGVLMDDDRCETVFYRFQGGQMQKLLTKQGVAANLHYSSRFSKDNCLSKRSVSCELRCCGLATQHVSGFKANKKC